MSKRRSTLETLTAEQAAFLQTESRQPEPAVAETRRLRPTSPKVVNRPPSPSTGQGENQASKKGSETVLRSTRDPLRTGRGQALQSVTLRLHSAVARALRKAAAERSIDYLVPFTQQAIAEEALRKWLAHAGYKIG